MRNGESPSVQSSAAVREGADQTHDFVRRCITLRDAHRNAEALAIFARELPSVPAVEGHHSLSLTLLADAQFEQGWHQYEFRWMREPAASQRSQYSVPSWHGQDLQGKTLLISCEQGFGDTIQFLRYARIVQALGARILLQAQQELHGLAGWFDGVDKVIDLKGENIAFDYHVDLLSLPNILQTNLSTVPAHVPYLRVEPEVVELWKDRLLLRDALNVGLVWAGNPQHVRDRDRSIELSRFSPIFEVENVSFFSLQKGEAESDIDTLGPGSRLTDVGSKVTDFSDTAAVVVQLDLIICVDTAVAHLAGALGKDIWLLVPHTADWRWLEDRDDTPWYPTMKLFRQQKRGEWKEVIERVKVALEARVKAGAAPTQVETPFVPLRPALPHQWIAGVTKWPGHRPGLSAVIDTRMGLVQYLPDEPVVGDAIGWYGEYLQSQLDLLSRWMTPGSVMLEAGAGIGLHTLGLARLIGAEGRVFVYEDDAIKRQILGQNLNLHKVAWATLMCRRLGAISEAQSADTPPQEESLDDLQLERLDWIKVNDGNRALEVLQGADETVWRLRAKLFLAANDAEQLEALIARAKDLGYRCWVHEAPLYNPQNFNRREGDIFGGRVATTLFAIPEEIDADAGIPGCRHIP